MAKKSKRNGAVPEPTPLSPDAPAPQTRALAAVYGEKLSAQAVQAWSARIAGTPILELAHRLGLTIESTKTLIREAHDAIAEDLKKNLDVNRELDLQRLDGLLSAYYRQALEGHVKSADVVLKLLAHRAKLTGVEPLPETGRQQPQSVLIWIQEKLPSINQMVDQLPLE